MNMNIVLLCLNSFRQAFVFEFLQCFELFSTVTFASWEVKEEGEEVNDERIPHQEEGHGRPQVMAVVVQFVRGEWVGKDIRQRQDWVEDEEETYLYVVLQESCCRGHHVCFWCCRLSQWSDRLAAGWLFRIGESGWLLIRARRASYHRHIPGSCSPLVLHSLDYSRPCYCFLMKFAGGGGVPFQCINFHIKVGLDN